MQAYLPVRVCISLVPSATAVVKVPSVTVVGVPSAVAALAAAALVAAALVAAVLVVAVVVEYRSVAPG